MSDGEDGDGNVFQPGVLLAGGEEYIHQTGTVAKTGAGEEIVIWRRMCFLSLAASGSVP